jgi:hypothetical protein
MAGNVVVNLCRFAWGILSERGTLYFSDGNDYQDTSTFTSCIYALHCDTGVLSINRCHFLNNLWCMSLYYITYTHFISTGSTFVNGNVDGINLHYSELTLFSDVEVNVVNIYYCGTGIELYRRGIITSYGINIGYCNHGITASDHSNIKPYTMGNLTSIPSKYGQIYHCDTGIVANNQSVAECIYFDIHDCNIGIHILNNSIGLTLYANTSQRVLVHDNDIGIYLQGDSTYILENADIRDNRINMRCYTGSTFEILSSTITNAKYRGIECFESAQGLIVSSTITNNTNQDLYTSLNSNVLIKNSTIDISTPLPDEPPVYTGWTAGSYNVEVNSKKSNGDIWGDDEGCA